MPDTIAAIATGGVRSAIGILRLSGPDAVRVVSEVFRSASGKPLAECGAHRLIFGTLLGAGGEEIDQVLATYSRAPGSYTGEDTAELQCHGSPAVLALGLESLFAHGARQALPGEFTRRAFLNGRMDLVQAEAVIDLIDAENSETARNAALQLSGSLSRRIGEVYDALTDLMAHFCAVLDYPDEDIDPFRTEALAASLAAQESSLASLLRTYRRGMQMKQGITCAIVGRPNAGKSSLLNALAGCDRAIVTDIPGTTRDTVEASVRLGTRTFRLIDTAGVRTSDDPIERLGVERSRAALRDADLVLVVWDSSAHLTQEDRELLALARESHPTLLALNKTDLPAAGDLPVPDGLPCVPVSAATGAGLDALEDALAALAPDAGEGSAGEILTNARQADAVRRALDRVTAAREGLESGVTPDAVLSEVEGAMTALGELTGRCVREDITDRIFSRFCVGK